MAIRIFSRRHSIRVMKDFAACKSSSLWKVFYVLKVGRSGMYITDGTGDKLMSTSSKDDNQKKEKRLGSSSIILQDGMYIQELPIIVRKIKDVPSIMMCKFQSSDQSDRSPCSSTGTPGIGEEESVKVTKSEKAELAEPIINAGLNTEESATEEGLARCSTLSELFKLLEIIPVAEVTPYVAAHALKCIATLRSNSEFRNERALLTLVDYSHDGLTDTFAWNAVIDRLCETICCNSNNEFLVEGLQAIHRGNLATKSNNGSNATPRDRLIEELLVRVAEGKVGLNHICDLAMLLHSINTESGSYAKDIDKLWTGISNNFSQINVSNITKVYSVLPLFKRPQKLLLNILEKCTYSCWWKLRIADIISILSSLVQINYSPRSLLLSLTKRLNLDVHTLTESDLLITCRCLLQLSHFDSNINRAIEKYVKVRNVNIKNIELIATIAEVCTRFRSCSPGLLDALAHIFIQCNEEFNPSQVFRIVRTYGMLNYVPSNSARFFACVEDILALKFVQFRPEDTIELLLACTFIQRFPLNFVHKIFNPFFLDRLHNTRDIVDLRKARANLKLLDTAMSLECSQYQGPLLMKDKTNKSVFKDIRLTRMHTELFNDFANILGGENNFVYSEYIPSLPFIDIYCIDFAFHLDHTGQPLPYQDKGITKRYRKAVIINLPEHFTNGQRHLVGIQAARVRHFEAVGYEVVLFEYEVLEKLKQQPTDRAAYLRSKLLP